MENDIEDFMGMVDFCNRKAEEYRKAGDLLSANMMCEIAGRLAKMGDVSLVERQVEIFNETFNVIHVVYDGMRAKLDKLLSRHRDFRHISYEIYHQRRENEKTKEDQDAGEKE